MFKLIDNIIEFDGYRVGTLWNEGVPATVRAEVRDALDGIGEMGQEIECQGCDDHEDTNASLRATLVSLREQLKDVAAERDSYAVMLGIER